MGPQDFNAQLKQMVARHMQELSQIEATGDVNMVLKAYDRHSEEIKALQAQFKQAYGSIPPQSPVQKPKELDINYILKNFK